MLVLLIVLGLVNRWYLGGFSTVEVKEQKMGPYLIAYTAFTGDYSKIGPTLDKVFQTLSGENIKATAGIGIYYTNPATAS